MIFIGIDPGDSGGFGVVNESGERVIAQKFKGLTEQDLWNALKEFTLSADVGLALLERVGSMPDQGVVSAFTFGTSYGFLRGILAASSVRYEIVSPQVWQKPFGLPTTKNAGGKTAKKNAHKAVAQQMFPGDKITHAVADALLLAEYARRVYVQRMAA